MLVSVYFTREITMQHSEQPYGENRIFSVFLSLLRCYESF